jgi:acyl carrier protein
MRDLVEPRVRRVVAECLGVGGEELTADVSLIDDLAADSLDLVELAIGLEGTFGISFPEAAIDDMRTFGDLVETVRGLTHGRDVEAPGPSLIWARVVPAESEASTRGLQRVGWLTPYTAETIAEDALRAGRGARLEVTVPPSVTDASLVHLQDRFAWLGERGVTVSVRRDHHLAPGRSSDHPYAAA